MVLHKVLRNTKTTTTTTTSVNQSFNLYHTIPNFKDTEEGLENTAGKGENAVTRLFSNLSKTLSSAYAFNLVESDFLLSFCKENNIPFFLWDFIFLETRFLPFRRTILKIVEFRRTILGCTVRILIGFIGPGLGG